MNIVCPLDVTLDLTERLKFVDLFIYKLIQKVEFDRPGERSPE